MAELKKGKLDDSDNMSVQDKIAQALTEKANGEYADFRQGYTDLWTKIYYDYIGQYQDGVLPKEKWRTRLFQKTTKIKVLAAMSQFTQAVRGNSRPIEVRARREFDQRGKESAARMQDMIEGQMAAAKYNDKQMIAALDAFLYGTCYIQGPITMTKVTKTWEEDPVAGLLHSMMPSKFKPKWRSVVREEEQPGLYNRNIFEMYQWPYCYDPQEGEGLFHRSIITEFDLMELRDVPGFDKDVINELVKEGANEFANTTTNDTTNERMSARGHFTNTKRKGYELLFYTGKFDAAFLRETGLDKFRDAYGYKEVWAWVVVGKNKSRLIKLESSPLVCERRPWFKTVYERVNYEPLGVGIGENVKDMSDAINGSMRMYFDAKKVALPQLAVNRSKLVNPSQTLQFGMMKIWNFAGGTLKDNIMPFNYPDISGGLLQMIELAERFADEITGIPKFTSGFQSKNINKTASGLSMLMNQQAQLLRSAIENFDDDITEPLAQAFYERNMQLESVDPKVKGDHEVFAQGLSSLMVKDQQNQMLMGLLTVIINPQVIKNPAAVKLLRMVGSNAGIKDVDSILPTEEDLKKLAEMDAKKAMQQLQNQSMPPQMRGVMPSGPGGPAPVMAGGAQPV